MKVPSQGLLLLDGGAKQSKNPPLSPEALLPPQNSRTLGKVFLWGLGNYGVEKLQSTDGAGCPAAIFKSSFCPFWVTATLQGKISPVRRDIFLSFPSLFSSSSAASLPHPACFNFLCCFSPLSLFISFLKLLLPKKKEIWGTPQWPVGWASDEVSGSGGDFRVLGMSPRSVPAGVAVGTGLSFFPLPSAPSACACSHVWAHSLKSIFLKNEKGRK